MKRKLYYFLTIFILSLSFSFNCTNEDVDEINAITDSENMNSSSSESNFSTTCKICQKPNVNLPFASHIAQWNYDSYVNKYNVYIKSGNALNGGSYTFVKVGTTTGTTYPAPLPYPQFSSSTISGGYPNYSTATTIIKAVKGTAISFWNYIKVEPICGNIIGSACESGYEGHIDYFK